MVAFVPSCRVQNEKKINIIALYLLDLLNLNSNAKSVFLFQGNRNGGIFILLLFADPEDNVCKT